MRLTVTTCVLVATTAVGGCEVNLHTEGLSARETKSFKVTGRPQLVLDTFDGAIELHSWDRPEVEVEIEKRAMEQVLLDEIRITAEQKGDVITLKVTGPTRQQFRGVTVGVHVSPTARLRVAVPRNSNIQATSGDGSIRAEAVDGKLVLTTVDGSVVGSRLGGELKIRSGDGSIRLDNVTGTLDLETTDGTIVLDDAKPTVLKARTGDGSIRAEIEPDTAMTENWDLTTSDGTIVLTLPGLFNAELDAETSDGSVRTTHPLLDDDAERREGEGRDERRERRRALRSTMGEGGKVLRIRTGDGSIRIER